MFYQLFVKQNSAFKKNTTTKKITSGFQPRVKSGPPPTVPTHPTHHLADPKPLWRSPPDPCGLAGDSFGWLVVFFCKWNKWEAKRRKQSNKHVTNATTIFGEKNEWIILVNYDIVHICFDFIDLQILQNMFRSFLGRCCSYDKPVVDWFPFGVTWFFTGFSLIGPLMLKIL